MNQVMTLRMGFYVDRKMQTLMALTLACVMLMCACSSAQLQTFFNLAESDIPILTQQAENILQIVDPADQALAQTVSSGVLAGITLVSDAITAYKANPNATTLQALAAALAKAGSDLPALLTAVHFSDPVVATAIEAVVAGVVTVFDILASQLPASSQTQAMTIQRNARLKVSVSRAQALQALQPSALRAAWNQNVCAANQKLHSCPIM